MATDGDVLLRVIHVQSLDNGATSIKAMHPTSLEKRTYLCSDPRRVIKIGDLVAASMSHVIVWKAHRGELKPVELKRLSFSS